MTDLSTPSKEAFAEQGFGLSISKSTPETIHDFILARMPAPGQTIADAATHHFASLRAISPALCVLSPPTFPNYSQALSVVSLPHQIAATDTK